MKKRPTKTKSAAKPRAVKKPSAKAKRPTAKKKAAATAAKATAYTPAPLKGDGWPPFRYPL